MKSLFISFLLCFFGPYFTCASDVEINMHPIDNAALADYNFERSEYLAYQQAFIDSLNTFFSDSELKQDVRIIQSLDPTLYPYYAFSAKPALTDSVRHALQKKLMSVTGINSLYLPYSTDFFVSINGGSTKRGLEFSPLLENPFDIRRKPYETFNFEQSFKAIQTWVKEGVIPVIAKIMNQKPDAMKSVFGQYEVTGELLLSRLNERQNLSISLAEKFPETPQLIPVLKVLFLISEGRFEYTYAYQQFIYQFEPAESLMRYLMDELSWRLYYYTKNENLIIRQENMTLLDSALLINPNSTALLYHRIDKVGSPLVSTYPHHSLRTRFAQSNPMSTRIMRANNKDAAYSNYLRTEMENLFIDAETFENSFPRYAEMAIELGAYEFAVDSYWMLWQAADFEPERIVTDLDQPMRVRNEEDIKFYKFRYHYAYSKLMETPLEIDKKTKKQYKRLDKKFRKRKKKHPAYKKFKY